MTHSEQDDGKLGLQSKSLSSFFPLAALSVCCDGGVGVKFLLQLHLVDLVTVFGESLRY